MHTEDRHWIHEPRVVDLRTRVPVGYARHELSLILYLLGLDVGKPATTDRQTTPSSILTVRIGRARSTTQLAAQGHAVCRVARALDVGFCRQEGQHCQLDVHLLAAYFPAQAQG